MPIDCEFLGMVQFSMILGYKWRGKARHFLEKIAYPVF